MASFLFGSSPQSVTQAPIESLARAAKRELTLEQLIEELPSAIRTRKELDLRGGSPEDPVFALMK